MNTSNSDVKITLAGNDGLKNLLELQTRSFHLVWQMEEYRGNDEVIIIEIICSNDLNTKTFVEKSYHARQCFFTKLKKKPTAYLHNNLACTIRIKFRERARELCSFFTFMVVLHF